MELFPDLKCVYFEGNGLTKIEGLETNVKMMSLYLQENLIRKIEGLGTMTDLRTVNLSENQIERIENLSGCVSLETLLLKRNRIGKNDETCIDDLRGLLEVPSIHVLDISQNHIGDPAIL